MRVIIREILNVGGFFAGETVTLAAQLWPDGGPEQIITIDDAALVNVTARHLLTPGMVLDLTLAGDRVERALLLGAPDHASLRAAWRQPSLELLSAPRVLSFRCPACRVWAVAVGDPPVCAVCGQPGPQLDQSSSRQLTEAQA
ncbi:hypothetical protein [Chloroflexus sp.]|uniref:hypothetical protein n=1 Tax=Chloroflexus sp. TaxID=1904827 RepID=UPI00262673CC|nr:hypothetical protein [uncultured Chloroflexus sp.]